MVPRIQSHVCRILMFDVVSPNFGSASNYKGDTHHGKEHGLCRQVQL